MQMKNELKKQEQIREKENLVKQNKDANLNSFNSKMDSLKLRFNKV